MEKKPGRNDPCPCGSGKKYKNCCLNKETAKKTYTENGKRKFKATVVSSGEPKSQSVFQAQSLTSPLQQRDIKPLDFNRFRSSKTDYRAEAKEESLPFEIKHTEEKKPTTQVQEKSPELPEEFNPTKEDYRE